MDEELKKALCQVSHIVEQDEAHCREWWEQATLEDKLGIWATIQRMCEHHKTNIEIAGRFAQLAFAQAVEKYEVKEEEDSP